ncbi:MAG TPA: ABC transporter ATP-binding protein [Ktedonobacterales bacterium]
MYSNDSAPESASTLDGVTLGETHHTPEPQAVPVIAVRDLMKSYRTGDNLVPALRGVTFAVQPGEFVAVMGASGSGKSTLMNLLGCLDRPTRGEYWLAGTRVSTLSPEQLALVRLRRIGFIFQGFNLLSRSTALKNVALPMVYSGIPAEMRERRARRALELVGLGDRMSHRPNQLSGGQQQRVAVARALVNEPALLLADEPTGNLDSRTGLEIMTLMQALNRQGITVLLVTHEPDIAAYASRILTLRDGVVLRDERRVPRSAASDLAAREAEDAQAQAPAGSGSNGAGPRVRVKEASR